jgi:hypothetical protein
LQVVTGSLECRARRNAVHTINNYTGKQVQVSLMHHTFLADIIASISSKKMTEGCSLRASENNARISFSPSPYMCRNSEETREGMLKITRRLKGD